MFDKYSFIFFPYWISFNSTFFIILWDERLFNKNWIKVDLLIVVYLFFSSLNFDISISHILFEVFASKKWKLNHCIIIHRYGKIKPGENIVYVGTAAQHRNNAFKACEFIIDYLKVKAPFWKIEQQNNKKTYVKSKKKDEKKIKVNY